MESARKHQWSPLIRIFTEHSDMVEPGKYTTAQKMRVNDGS